MSMAMNSCRLGAGRDFRNGIMSLPYMLWPKKNNRTFYYIIEAFKILLNKAICRIAIDKHSDD